MMSLFIILGAVLVGALFSAWRTALHDVGPAAVATAVSAVVIATFGVTMVLGVMPG